MLADVGHPVLVATISAVGLIIVAIIQNWRNLKATRESRKAIEHQQLQAQLDILAALNKVQDVLSMQIRANGKEH
jgi:archaellum component FlaF (FlaF/FlaG flagellin family)